MAIQINKSVIEHMRDWPLASTVTVPLERGMVMSFVNDNGVRAVRPCAAAAGERVAGLLWLSTLDELEIPMSEAKAVPAVGPFTVTLKNIPVSGTFGAATAAGVALTVTTDYTISGNVVTFVLGGPAALAAGSKVTISYRKAVLAAELQQRSGGRRSVNNGGEGLYKEVTVAYGQCDVLSSCFDTSVTSTFLPEVQILTAANGRFTTAAGGTAFGRCSVSAYADSSPGLEQLFVGVSYSTTLAP